MAFVAKRILVNLTTWPWQVSKIKQKACICIKCFIYIFYIHILYTYIFFCFILKIYVYICKGYILTRSYTTLESFLNVITARTVIFFLCVNNELAINSLYPSAPRDGGECLWSCLHLLVQDSFLTN